MQNELNLNTLKKDSLKKVEINEIADPDPYKGATKQEVQQTILGEVDKAIDRYKKNFDGMMEEKYEKEQKEKIAGQSDDELKEFMDINTSDNNSEYKSDIDMDTPEPITHINHTNSPTPKKNVIVTPNKIIAGENNSINVGTNPTPDDYSGDDGENNTITVDSNPTPKDPVDDYDKEFSFNPDDVSGSLEESEKIDDADFENILGGKSKLEIEQEQLVSNLKEKLNPITMPVDLTTLTVSKKPTFVNNALLNQATSRHVSDWLLFETDQIVSMKSFLGTELENIDSRNYPDRTRYNMFLEVYKNIFDHIMNKDNSIGFTDWLKTFKFFNLNHLWFSVYKSTFEKANIIPYVCKCGHRFVKERKIMDLVRFRTDEDKARFDEQFNTAPQILTGTEYNVRRKQITNNFVIDFRDPSIWNIIFENAILPDKFRKKYAKLLNTISFIDSMFMVQRDEAGNAIGLSPIKYKEYPDDMVKDIMSRIYTYAKLLETFSGDEKTLVDSIIVELSQEHAHVRYVIPECTCEQCGKKIEELPATGEELVFTRQGLAEMILS